MMSWLSQYSGYLVLIAFFAAFSGTVIWAYWPVNRDRLEQYRNIPFKEDE